MRKTREPTPPIELPSYTVEDAPPAHFRDDQAPIDRHEGTGLVLHDAPLAEELIDPDAAKVIRRLESAGFQAYLVGGCVRDLLLGRKPKDFDVATNARPENVRSLFRNCRIIGRRFRLAHVMYGAGKVIEVATFRRNPGGDTADDEADGDDLLIRSDNVFGDAHEDAVRRDFTINALFYDLERQKVLDWCGGMADIRSGTIHTIGDPSVRFREDPVRILRAIKFAARLDLGIAPDVYDAMISHRDDLARAARPRIFEEILRLLRGGAAHRSAWLLWECGAMAVLLPELAAFIDDDEATNGGCARFFRAMSAIDEQTRRTGRPVNDVALLTTLLTEPLEEACYGAADRLAATEEFLEPVIARVAIPRRIADAIRRIVAMLPRLAAGKPGRFARTEFFGLALDVLELTLTARGASSDLAKRLRNGELASPQPAGGRAPLHHGAGTDGRKTRRVLRPKRDR